jgi:hypothetical protein
MLPYRRMPDTSATDADMKSTEVTRVTEADQSSEQNKTVAATTGTGAPATTDRSAPMPSSTANSSAGMNTSARATPRRTRLPRTASPLALYELVSGLAFAGALGIRKLRGI